MDYKAPNSNQMLLDTPDDLFSKDIIKFDHSQDNDELANGFIYYPCHSKPCC